MTAINKTTHTTPICDACWQSLGGTCFPFLLLPEEDRPDGCTCVEGERDPHMLHEACDEAAIRSLEASLEDETPEPPTLEALEEARLMLERMGATLVGPWQPEAFLEGLQAPEYAPDAGTVQANRDHDGICEMLLEGPVEVPIQRVTKPLDWDSLLPEGAEWADAEPAKPARAEWLETWANADGPEDMRGQGTFHAPTVTPKVRDISPMFDTHDADLEDAEFTPAPTASERAELLAKGLDPEFVSVIGAACSA